MTNVPVEIRTATPSDARELFTLGHSIKELQTSATVPFMDEDELQSVIRDDRSVFLCAVAEDKPVGFIYTTVQDLDGRRMKHWACLTYLAVTHPFRGKGIASRLLDACLRELKRRGVTNVYGWARSKSAIVAFLERRGFTKGHEYIWMDREI